VVPLVGDFPNDLDAVEFVAVGGRREERGRPRVLAVDEGDGCPDRVAEVRFADPVADVLCLPGIDASAVVRERVPEGAAHTTRRAGGVDKPGELDERCGRPRLAADIGAGPIKDIVKVNLGSVKSGRSLPVVDLVVGVGGTQHTVTASVEDRSQMDYPLLLGRDVLQHYHVDVQRRADAGENVPAPPEEEAAEEEEE